MVHCIAIPHRAHRLLLASGLVALLAACAGGGLSIPKIPLIGSPPEPDWPEAYRPSQPDFGMAVIEIRHPVSTVRYLEVLPVTADGKPDPARPASAAIDARAGGLQPSRCMVAIQVCIIPDLAPGRYYLSRMGWSGDIRFDLAAAHAGQDKTPTNPGSGNLFFTVPKAGVVYAGSYDWTGAIKGPPGPFSFRPSARADERLALQALLQTPYFTEHYAAWAPMVRARLASPTPASWVKRGKPVGTPVAPPPATLNKKRPHTPHPEYPDDGMAVVVMKNEGAAPDYVRAEPVTFDGRNNMGRRRPSYLQGRFTTDHWRRSECYGSVGICVLFDLAPGKYAFASFGLGQAIFSLRGSTLKRLLGVSRTEDTVSFVVAPGALTYFGTYDWAYQRAVIGDGSFSMEEVAQPDELLTLQLLLRMEIFRHKYPGWVPLVERRLQRLKASR